MVDLDAYIRDANRQDVNSLDGKNTLFNWKYHFENSYNGDDSTNAIKTRVLIDRKTNKLLGAYEFSIDFEGASKVLYIGYIEKLEEAVKYVGTKLITDAIEKIIEQGCNRTMAFARCSQDSENNPLIFFEKLRFKQRKEYDSTIQDSGTYFMLMDLDREDAIELLGGRDEAAIEC